MRYIVGPGGFVNGAVSIPVGTLVEGGPCPPIDAVALDADCAVLMFLRYRRQRRKLQRRLWPTEEELFHWITREIDEPALLVMWGLRPRPHPAPKPTSDFAEQLTARLAKTSNSDGDQQRS